MKKSLIWAIAILCLGFLAFILICFWMLVRPPAKGDINLDDLSVAEDKWLLREAFGQVVCDPETFSKYILEAYKIKYRDSTYVYFMIQGCITNKLKESAELMYDITAGNETTEYSFMGEFAPFFLKRYIDTAPSWYRNGIMALRDFSLYCVKNYNRYEVWLIKDSSRNLLYCVVVIPSYVRRKDNVR